MKTKVVMMVILFAALAAIDTRRSRITALRRST